MPDPALSRELLERRVAALYSVDGRGRLVGTNEWDSRPAPRCHLMRTPTGPIVRFEAGVPDGLAERLQALGERETWDSAPQSPPRGYDAYLSLLGEQAAVTKVWSGPAYAAMGDAPAGASAISVDEGNAGLLAGRFDDWLPDVPHRRPFMAVVEDGKAVSICASARISPAAHCAGVETHPNHRQRGYAVNAVAAWAREVRALGAVPFYSTSWENLASQRVAGRLDWESFT